MRVLLRLLGVLLVLASSASLWLSSTSRDIGPWPRDGVGMMIGFVLIVWSFAKPGERKRDKST